MKKLILLTLLLIGNYSFSQELVDCLTKFNMKAKPDVDECLPAGDSGISQGYLDCRCENRKIAEKIRKKKEKERQAEILLGKKITSLNYEYHNAFKLGYDIHSKLVRQTDIDNFEAKRSEALNYYRKAKEILNKYPVGRVDKYLEPNLNKEINDLQNLKPKKTVSISSSDSYNSGNYNTTNTSSRNNTNSSNTNSNSYNKNTETKKTDYQIKMENLKRKQQYEKKKVEIIGNGVLDLTKAVIESGIFKSDPKAKALRKKKRKEKKEKDRKIRERKKKMMTDDSEMGKFHIRFLKHFVKKIDLELPKKLNLSPGEKKVLINFKITTEGTVYDINVTAPHKLYKEEVIRVIKLSPIKKFSKDLRKKGEVIYNTSFQVLVN
jgi:hypothetical protein